MSANQILNYLLLGGILGIVGQSIRSVIAWSKIKNENRLRIIESEIRKTTFEEVKFSWKEFVVMLIVGFTAGVIAMLITIEVSETPCKEVNKITSKMIMAIIAAGYAGADFIQNTMGRVLGKP